MKKMRLIQIDVTANNEQGRALMKKFDLFGPPRMILFNASRRKIPQGGLVGYVPPERFVGHPLRAQAL